MRCPALSEIALGRFDTFGERGIWNLLPRLF